MRLADNLDKHKIPDRVEIRPDRTIDLELLAL